MPEPALPTQFRQEIFQQFIPLLRARESCALVGVGSSGKSNIARHLTRADVRLHYFGADTPNVFVLYVNCKPLAHHPPPKLYLQAFDQLTRAAEELNGTYQPLLPELAELWQAAQASPDMLARRNLDRAFDRIVQGGARLIILVLDDCDDLFAKAPPVLFADLRELRDNHKQQLAYLTLTRRQPVFLRPDAHEFEEFFELMSASDHIIPITPYREADAQLMMQRLAARQDPPLHFSDERLHRLFELSGGHPGLIRSIFFVIRLKPDTLGSITPAELAAKPDVAEECGKIVSSLEEGERDDLDRLVSHLSPTEAGLRRLKIRQLVRAESLTPQIVSPVFEAYLRRKLGITPATVTLEFVDASRQVHVNGQPVKSLNWPEYELLKYLYTHRPQTCHLNEILPAIHAAEKAYLHNRRDMGKPAQRVHDYILQIRAKLGPAGQLIQGQDDGYRFAEA